MYCMYLDSALYRVGLLKVKTVIGLPFFYDKNQSTVCIWTVGVSSLPLQVGFHKPVLVPNAVGLEWQLE